MNIVIIDDNQMNVSLLSHLVKRVDDGCTIGFTDPRAGLDWCLHHDPDLVMVDDRMPELSGLEFIRQFRAGASDNVPVLMLTAPAERALRDRALEVGVTDFIGRPIDRTEFLSRTRSMLALRRFQKALAERTDALTDQVRDANAELAARELAIVRRLAEAAETRDPAARGRLARIADYTEIIARGLLLNPAEQRLLREAAPLHDIGCIAVCTGIADVGLTPRTQRATTSPRTRGACNEPDRTEGQDRAGHRRDRRHRTRDRGRAGTRGRERRHHWSAR